MIFQNLSGTTLSDNCLTRDTRKKHKKSINLQTHKTQPHQIQSHRIPNKCFVFKNVFQTKIYI